MASHNIFSGGLFKARIGFYFSYPSYKQQGKEVRMKKLFVLMLTMAMVAILVQGCRTNSETESTPAVQIPSASKLAKLKEGMSEQQVLAVGVAGAFAEGAGIAHPDAFAQNGKLGRGVNVMNKDPIWKSLTETQFREEYFQRIHAVGFRHVRISLKPIIFGGLDTEDHIRPEWFAALDWAMEKALAQKLMVVFDLHEHLAMGLDPQGNKKRYLTAWSQIAERYKNAPAEVLFELLNEPHKELTPVLWNQYLVETLQLVRQSNPRRTVIIGPGHYNTINELEKLVLPEDDRNLIVTVHYYSPMAFTHQGATWIDQQYPIGISWNGTPEERQSIGAAFDKAQEWARRHNRPLYLGEFGVYDTADMPSRVRWTAEIVRQAERRGWSWGYWQFAGRFGVYDITENRWIDPIRNALIPPLE
jgi:endoglucanase